MNTTMNTTMKTNKTLTILTIGLFLMGTMLTACSKKEGCTDPAANNFDVEAETDDGSCTYDKEEKAEHIEAHLTFNFSHHFDGVPITAANFNQFNFTTANGDTISITKLRYLVSDMKLYTTTGDSVVMNGYQLIDLNDPTSLSYSPGETDLGSFAGVGFNFGFDTTDNAGNYASLNSASWDVPMMMGGGYHNMQFEGRYKDNGVDSVFAIHQIAKKRPTMMAPFEANHINIRMSGIALNEHNVVVEVSVNLAEWFRNPTVWDLNAYHSMLMPNYTAQNMMQANGYNVFSITNVFQRK